MARVKNVYESLDLKQVLGNRATESQINKNQLNFVQTVLKNLFIVPCQDAVEFNLTVRSLNKFFRSNKSIGLIVIDGIHFIES